MAEMEQEKPRILYCRCAHAQVIEPQVKDEVLTGLCASGCGFETASDLCQMSATKDPALKRLAETPNLQIVACYKRAVRWLFDAAGEPLPEKTPVHNMRTESAEQILTDLKSEKQTTQTTP
ncbi:MAG: hypothetical protein R3236_08675 [Phycisphaeraceae bacterium]|nr:hypothetical protein [Phycisphaeraceae bacterium]